MNTNKYFIASVIVIVLILIAIILLHFSYPCSSYLNIGTFIILTLTLIAVMIYAYDTKILVNISKLKWEKESISGVTYEMGMLRVNDHRTNNTYFSIVNPTTSFIQAKVNCHFKIYNSDAEGIAPYNGREIWVVFPQQTSQGWFSLVDLLAEKHKSIQDMQSERNDENIESQLTMDLEIEFRDERGQKRVYPQRRHYFDFNRWKWIPVLTTTENRDD